MQRIVRGRSATITHTFDADPSPATATVTVVRSDGTELHVESPATRTGVGVFTFTLTPTDTARLDTLTVTWAATFDAQIQTFVDLVEVAGDVLFTIAQAREALGDLAFDAQKITDKRTTAERDIERGLNYALVPRYRTSTMDIRYPPLRVPRDVTALRSITIGGEALTEDELAAVSFTDGFLSFSHWPNLSTQRFAMVVAYEHGLASPPPGASEVVLALALSRLSPASASSGIDPRAESIITVDGTVRLRANDGQFSVAGVNEWVRANRRIAIA